MVENLISRQYLGISLLLRVAEELQMSFKPNVDTPRRPWERCNGSFARILGTLLLEQTTDHEDLATDCNVWGIEWLNSRQTTVMTQEIWES